MQLHDKHLEFGMEFAYSKHIEYCNISNELKVKFGRFLHVSTQYDSSFSEPHFPFHKMTNAPLIFGSGKFVIAAEIALKVIRKQPVFLKHTRSAHKFPLNVRNGKYIVLIATFAP